MLSIRFLEDAHVCSVSALMFDYILTGPTSGVSQAETVRLYEGDKSLEWNPTLLWFDEDFNEIRVAFDTQGCVTDKRFIPDKLSFVELVGRRIKQLFRAQRTGS